MDDEGGGGGCGCQILPFLLTLVVILTESSNYHAIVCYQSFLQADSRHEFDCLLNVAYLDIRQHALWKATHGRGNQAIILDVIIALHDIRGAQVSIGKKLSNRFKMTL